MINKLPRARTAEILEQEAGKELLIYDLRTNKTLALNETLTTVFKACNGKTSFDDLYYRNNFNNDLIHFALNELQINNLLENYESNHFAGLSRREVIKKVGFASMVALPLVSSLIAPSSAQAQSGGCVTNSNCPSANNGCQAGICQGGTCSFAPAPAGTSAGNGQICDGSGNAVQCLSSNDCPGQDTSCQSRTCTNGTCGFSFQPNGTPVAEGICNGSGGITPIPLPPPIEP
jgi:hypothetical protein